MPKLTKDELQKRRMGFAKRSRGAVAAKGLVQFRLEADKILRLYEIAAERKIGVSELLRQLVNQCIEGIEVRGDFQVTNRGRAEELNQFVLWMMKTKPGFVSKNPLMQALKEFVAIPSVADDRGVINAK